MYYDIVIYFIEEFWLLVVWVLRVKMIIDVYVQVKVFFDVFVIFLDRRNSVYF